MTFDDIFDIISENEIRLQGHRFGIEDVLFYFVDGYSPEEIQTQLPTLSLKEIYATITYYLYNFTEVQAYLAQLESRQEERYQESKKHPSPVAERLRQLKAKQASAVTA